MPFLSFTFLIKTSHIFRWNFFQRYQVRANHWRTSQSGYFCTCTALCHTDCEILHFLSVLVVNGISPYEDALEWCMIYVFANFQNYSSNSYKINHTLLSNERVFLKVLQNVSHNSTAERHNAKLHQGNYFPLWNISSILGVILFTFWLINEQSPYNWSLSIFKVIFAFHLFSN